MLEVRRAGYRQSRSKKSETRSLESGLAVCAPLWPDTLSGSCAEEFCDREDWFLLTHWTWLSKTGVDWVIYLESPGVQLHWGMAASRGWNTVTWTSLHYLLSQPSVLVTKLIISGSRCTSYQHGNIRNSTSFPVNPAKVSDFLLTAWVGSWTSPEPVSVGPGVCTHRPGQNYMAVPGDEEIGLMTHTPHLQTKIKLKRDYGYFSKQQMATRIFLSFGFLKVLPLGIIDCVAGMKVFPVRSDLIS